jgi:hypothetical protein
MAMVGKDACNGKEDATINPILRVSGVVNGLHQ